MGYWLPPLIAAVANALLGVLVVSAAPRSPRRHAFGLLTIALILWNLYFFTMFFVRDFEIADALTRVLRLGGFFLPVAALYFVYALRRRSSPLWTPTLSVSLAIAVGLAAADVFGGYVAELRSSAAGYHSVAGPAYPVFAVFLVLNCLLALAIIGNDYRTTDDAQLRLELRFWLMGGALAFVFGVTNFLPAYGVPSYPLGVFGSTAWVALVGYAFVRHRLMGVDVFVSKGMALLFAVLLVVVPAVALLHLAQAALLDEPSRDLTLITLLVVLVVAFAFPAVRYALEPSLHASLFSAWVAPRMALASFTRSVTRILDHERLVRELATVLTRNFGVRAVVIAVATAPKKGFEIAYAVGTNSVPVEALASPRFYGFVDRLRGAVLRREVEAEHAAGDARDTGGEVGAVFRDASWEVLVPFRVGPTLLGFVALGSKQGRGAYSLQDLEVVEELGAEAAIALENARLYAEVQQSQAVLQRADRSSALGVLAAGIAHEIRNPLVSIQTFFQLAPHRLDDEEFVTSFLTTASNEVTRISGLINELLAFARSPSSEFAVTDLNEVARGAFVLLAPEARQHGLQLVEHFDPTPPLVWGNHEQLRQVLINLLFNAVQATDRGGTVTVSTRRVRLEGRDFGQLEVHDTGHGIAAEALENIYHPFFTTKASGTGLGLAIVQRIVAEHDGRIAVASEPGRGTYFFVDVPACDLGASVARD